MTALKKITRQILYATDQANFTVACDIEVCERLGIEMGFFESAVWRGRCFLRDFVRSLFVSAVDARASSSDLPECLGHVQSHPLEITSTITE